LSYTFGKSLFALHYIPVFQDVRSTVQTEQAMPGSGRGAGPFYQRQQIANKHICGTVVCSIGVPFFCLMEQATSNGVSKEKSQHRIANGSGKWGILL
jgi:hypothetical protein